MNITGTIGARDRWAGGGGKLPPKKFEKPCMGIRANARKNLEHSDRFIRK
jgi:hypothetical protein